MGGSQEKAKPSLSVHTHIQHILLEPCDSETRRTLHALHWGIPSDRPAVFPQSRPAL